MMSDLVIFGAGTAAGVIAMLPTAIVLWRSGAAAREDRRVEVEKRKLAELACGEAQARAVRHANERNAATTHLTDALAKIVEMEPLAAIGEKRRVSWRKNDATRDRKRAKTRAAVAK